MSQHIHISASVRTNIGHAAHLSRKNKTVPGVLYGKGQNIPIEIPKNLFLSSYKKSGETRVIYLTVNNTTYPVIIQKIQKHPITGEILHVEFLIVNLSEKIRTRVPIHIEGECPIVVEGRGVLLQITEDLEIEALPTEIPEKISVNISSLQSLDQEIKVKDILPCKNVEIVSDPEQIVVKIGKIITEEAQQESEQKDTGVANQEEKPHNQSPTPS